MMGRARSERRCARSAQKERGQGGGVYLASVGFACADAHAIIASPCAGVCVQGAGVAGWARDSNLTPCAWAATTPVCRGKGSGSSSMCAGRCAIRETEAGHSGVWFSLIMGFIMRCSNEIWARFSFVPFRVPPTLSFIRNVCASRNKGVF